MALQEIKFGEIRKRFVKFGCQRYRLPLVIHFLLPTVICMVFSLLTPLMTHAQVRMYNTVKQKLMEGKLVTGGTVTTSDPNIYCAMANAGFDYLWIEMQHSPLTYSDVAKMIWACKDAPAIPFIRVPNATEGDIQKATDIGALGIIVPMVHTVKEAQDAVMYAKFPPLGRRSRGGGQHSALWGKDYRETYNDNVMIVIMIESPEGVAIVDQIAAVPGVDVVFAASGDLASFTGWERSDPRYKAMVTKIHDATLKAGKKLAGPLAWIGRQGFSFFQGWDEKSLIKAGAQLGLTSAQGSRGGLDRDVATGDDPN